MGKNYYLNFRLPFGEMISEINQEGQILGLWFKEQRFYPELDRDLYFVGEDELKGNKKAEWKFELPVLVKVTMNELVTQLDLYQRGELKKFNLKLAPSGTEFRECVWKILQEIPMGETMTYGQIAKILCKDLGKSKMSAQAVGGAVGHNPIAILIPCHRVIGANGSLTGYAGGLDKKVALLKIEGIL